MTKPGVDSRAQTDTTLFCYFCYLRVVLLGADFKTGNVEPCISKRVNAVLDFADSLQTLTKPSRPYCKVFTKGWEDSGKKKGGGKVREQ